MDYSASWIGRSTCHWHHARFDLATGGKFDPGPTTCGSFPVEVRDGEVWVDLSSRSDPQAHHRERLRKRLERNISLVNAKAVPALAEALRDPDDPVVRGHAAWALGRIGGSAARAALQAARRSEEDPQVLEEIQAALSP